MGDLRNLVTSLKALRAVIRLSEASSDPALREEVGRAKEVYASILDQNPEAARLVEEAHE